MIKPNLFIVGAPKAGTSFLWDKLRKHQEVFFTENPEKELNYFADQELQKESYYKYYRIKDETKYLKCFKAAKLEKSIVDGSVSYFAYPAVPQRIHNFNPNAKIVIILRDPIKRAFSHYQMDKRMGYATKPLEEYLKSPLEYPAHYHQYINNSLYAKNIKNYLKVFGEKQILILHLKQIGGGDFESLYNFLEIKKDVLPIESTQAINRNKVPRNFISKTLQHNRHLATILKKVIPKGVVKLFESFLYKGAEKVEMTKTEEEALRFCLGSDIEELKSMYNFKI
jgi:hypothetical protein